MCLFTCGQIIKNHRVQSPPSFAQGRQLHTTSRNWQLPTANDRAQHEPETGAPTKVGRLKPKTACLSSSLRVSSNCSNCSNPTKKFTANSTPKPKPLKQLWPRTSPNKKTKCVSEQSCKPLPPPHFLQRSSRTPNCSTYAPKCSRRAQLERLAIWPTLTHQRLTTKARKFALPLEYSAPKPEPPVVTMGLATDN